MSVERRHPAGPHQPAAVNPIVALLATTWLLQLLLLWITVSTLKVMYLRFPIPEGGSCV